MKAKLKAIECITGELSVNNNLQGELEQSSKLEGTLYKTQGLNGKLSDCKRISGSLINNISSLKGIMSNESDLNGTLANEVLRGYSAYQIAVLNGYEGTEKEWLESLHSNGSVKWANVEDKPIQFPPTKHNHNDIYYTKPQTDELIPKKAVEVVVPVVAEKVVPEVIKDVVPEIAVTPNDKITNEEIESIFRTKGWSL